MHRLSAHFSGPKAGSVTQLFLFPRAGWLWGRSSAAPDSGATLEEGKNEADT